VKQVIRYRFQDKEKLELEMEMDLQSDPKAHIEQCVR
jgi:hypothetical protein